MTQRLGVMSQNYSDDNCTCKAETIDKDCPRHGEVKQCI